MHMRRSIEPSTESVLSGADGVTPGVAIKLLSARSMIKKQSLTALVRCIERTDLPVPAREGLWILLQHTSLHVPDAVHWKVLKSEFEKCKECQEGQGQVNACIARTISNSASKIPNDERESLRKEMHARLKGLNLLTESVSAYMEALAKLSDSGCNSWIEDICRDAQRLLESYINGESVNVSHVNRALFTVGEAVIICNNVVNDSLKNLVQALLAPSVGRLEGIDGEPLKKLSDRSVQVRVFFYFFLKDIYLSLAFLLFALSGVVSHHEESYHDSDTNHLFLGRRKPGWPWGSSALWTKNWRSAACLSLFR